MTIPRFTDTLFICQGHFSTAISFAPYHTTNGHFSATMLTHDGPRERFIPYFIALKWINHVCCCCSSAAHHSTVGIGLRTRASTISHTFRLVFSFSQSFRFKFWRKKINLPTGQWRSEGNFTWSCIFALQSKINAKPGTSLLLSFGRSVWLWFRNQIRRVQLSVRFVVAQTLHLYVVLLFCIGNASYF